MPDGIETLEEAFAAAASESEEVQTDDSETAEPAVEEEEAEASEQAEDEASDQPDVADESEADEDDMQSIVDDMLKQDPPSDEEDTETAEITDESVVTVDLGNGAEEVTIKQLVEGNLRQADYTRKTQELAAQRGDSEDAIAFHQAFTEDPMGFAAALAARAGLIDENAQPVKRVEAAKFQTQEEVEAEIERRVEERVQEDPRIRDSEIAAARVRVNAVFDGLETEFGVSLDAKQRQAIIDEAARRGTGDVELVFKSNLYDAQKRRQRAEGKKNAATAKPTASPATPPEDEEQQEAINSVDDAFEAALAVVQG